MRQDLAEKQVGKASLHALLEKRSLLELAPLDGIRTHGGLLVQILEAAGSALGYAHMLEKGQSGKRRK
jgi:hypothetical protein